MICLKTDWTVNPHGQKVVFSTGKPCSLQPETGYVNGLESRQPETGYAKGLDSILRSTTVS